MEELEHVKHERDTAYHERSLFIRFLTKIFQSCIKLNDNDPEWPIIYITTGVGQLSWHIHKNDLSLFPHVPFDNTIEWDKHTTEEKYIRMDKLAEEIRTMLEKYIIAEQIRLKELETSKKYLRMRGVSAI